MSPRAGYKTRHKDEILAFLRENEGSHITAGEIHHRFHEQGISIGMTTIYRQLDKLVEEGIVRKYIVDPTSGACFEYSGEDGHGELIHCKCEKCGKLIHLQRQEVERAMRAVAGVSDFEMDAARTVFYGICGSCKETGRK